MFLKHSLGSVLHPALSKYFLWALCQVGTSNKSNGLTIFNFSAKAMGSDTSLRDSNTSWMTRCYCGAKRSLIKQRQRATEAQKHPHVVVEADLRTHSVGGSALDEEALVIVGTVDQRTQLG